MAQEQEHMSLLQNGKYNCLITQQLFEAVDDELSDESSWDGDQYIEDDDVEYYLDDDDYSVQMHMLGMDEYSMDELPHDFDYDEDNDSEWGVSQVFHMQTDINLIICLYLKQVILFQLN